MRLPALATGLALAVVALAFVTEMLPGLLRQTPASAGTPVPFGTPAPADLTLHPRSEACQQGIAIDPSVATATVAARPTAGSALPPLLLTLSGTRYRAQTLIASQPGSARITVPISPPAHAVIGKVCVRDAGTRQVVLSGTGDPRVLTRTRATVNGREVAGAFILTFAERRPRSAIAALPDLIERAATFSAAGPWLYWLLLPLVVLGVPLLVAGALLLSLRESETEHDDR